MKEYYKVPCPVHSYLISSKKKIPTAITKTFIRDYGNVSEKRIGELRRRVILPVKPDDGSDYWVGRKGENGRIQEREPSY